MESDYKYPIWHFPSINSNIEIECNLNILKEGIDNTTLIVSLKEDKSDRDISFYSIDMKATKKNTGKSFLNVRIYF